MTLPKKNVEFEYLTSNSDRFTNDFMNFVLTDVPFFALQDQLLYLAEEGLDRFKFHLERSAGRIEYDYYIIPYKRSSLH
jgi:hypothetical protein